MQRHHEQDVQGYQNAGQPADLALSVLESLEDPVFVFDNDAAVVFANRAAASLTGRSTRNLLGGRWPLNLTLLDANHKGVALDGGTNADGFWYVRTPAGDEIPVVLSTAHPRRDGFSELTVVVLHPARRLHGLVQHLAYQAAHDPLTHLVNRIVFIERLENLRERAQEHGESHALLYLDLDGFKQVNDACGHRAGDELLQQIAALFAANVRARDSLARLGGDEFGVLLEHCDADGAEEIGHQLRAALGAATFTWGDHRFEVGVSVGIAPVTGNPGSPEALLAKADAACYTAKREGLGVHTAREGDGRSHDTRLRSVSTPLASVRPGAEERRRMIEVAAYYRALQRGLEPGREPEDWFEAERLVSLIYDR